MNNFVRISIVSLTEEFPKMKNFVLSLFFGKKTQKLFKKSAKIILTNTNKKKHLLKDFALFECVISGLPTPLIQIKCGSASWTLNPYLWLNETLQKNFRKCQTIANSFMS